MKLKLAFIVAIFVSLISITFWELYWRNQEKIPDFDDDKGLWAEQRKKVEKAGSSSTVLIGSSRVLFDIQLDVWEEKTGQLPIMLASPGSTPLPVLRDIVDNTSFNGTLIVGVTPGIFFSTTYPEAPPWKRAQTKVDHFKKRTYAQKLNHLLSLPFQENFVFVSGSEEKWSDDIDLGSLLSRISIGDRFKSLEPPFYNFSYSRIDRNTRMSERTVNDTTFANTIKKVWFFFGSQSPPPDKVSTIAFFNDYAAKFQRRGGKIILLRCPSSGALKQGENAMLPRQHFWDSLVVSSGLRSYHFEDYETLKNFECPEWSHLSGPDADKFTANLIEILQKDKILANLKK